jgi:flagellar biosynthesis/type III secretory pathway M-ring protein FliF/YscJ
MYSIKNLMEHAEGYDKKQQAKANEALVHAFGPNKAFVTVSSRWNHEQSTSRSETVEPTKKVISEETVTSETPQGVPGVGGPAGVSSNLSADFGVENAGAAAGSPSAQPSAELAKTKESKRTYDASRSTTQTVRSTPQLEHLSVSLMLDESLAGKRDEIEGIVKAAVGFDPARNDTFSLGTTTFAVESDAGTEPADGSAEGEGSESGPSPMLELLLQRGIELAAALAFIVLLFKTLKGAGKANPAGMRADAGQGPEAPDPELLARHQIEELVRTDPRRVGEVLSRWADESSPTGP